MPFPRPFITNVAAMGAITPASIMGSALVGWWTADRDDLITQSATLVSSWKDVIGGYDLVQATGGFKPIYSATSFNGRPGVTFDGSDDYLRTASTPASFPVGSATSEIWACASQDVLAADTTARCVGGYGSGSTTIRGVRRSVATGVNRANLTAQAVTATNTSVDLSGRHTIRGIFVDGATNATVDGIAGTNGAPSLATVASNVTVGALTASSAAQFWQGPVHQILVIAGQPDAAQLTALNAYFAARI